MGRKKITKQQRREKQILEDKKFKKYLRNGAIIGIVVVALIQIFFVHWCDTKHIIQKYVLYKKEISPELICEVENVLKFHKSQVVDVESKMFYVCGARCKHYIVEHYQQYANTIDAYSGDSICKADAIIGLKEKGQSFIVYFENKQTFKKYYGQNR